MKLREAEGECETLTERNCATKKRDYSPPFSIGFSVLEHGMQRKWTIVIVSGLDTVSLQMCCTICHKITAFQHHLHVFSGTQRLSAFLPNC